MRPPCTSSCCYASSLLSCTTPPPPGLYTLSLHDALPIWERVKGRAVELLRDTFRPEVINRIDEIVVFHPLSSMRLMNSGDRKSTRLNSSHRCISYAVFCLKKKRRRGTERGSRAKD